MHRGEVPRVIEGVLAASPEVSGAAYFGSTATNTADAYSDIDLVVRCPNASAVPVVERLNAALPIALFRPFSAGRKPSGRYWFHGASRLYMTWN